MPDGLRRAYIDSVQTRASVEYDGYLVQNVARLENPAQLATMTVDSKGLLVLPHEGDWHWGLRTVDIGCVHSTRESVIEALPHVDHNRVELHRKNLDEWYVNGPAGWEQGFVISEAPPCAGIKSIRLAIDGNLQGIVTNPDMLGRGRQVEFVDAQSRPRLAYTDLSVVDAQGKTISAWMTVDDGSVSIEMDDTNAVYPLTIDPLVWTQQAKLHATAPVQSGYFGSSVAISGNTAVVGSPGADVAYVFVRNGATWTFEAQLLPTDPGGGAGASVAIDGDTVLVGAPSYKVTPPFPEGRVYVYTRANGVWSLQQKLIPNMNGKTLFRFGSDVAISGDGIAIGADGDYTMSPTYGRLFMYHRTNGQWNQEADITPPGTGWNDYFGIDVDIDGDTVIAPLWGSSASVYVYVRNAGTWTQQAAIPPPPSAMESVYYTALSGDTILGGLLFSSQFAQEGGEVVAYTRSGTTWTVQSTFTANDVTADLNFGSSIDFDGDLAVVGTEPGVSGYAAPVYVFQRVGTTWQQQQKIACPTPTIEVFGRSVAISGTTIIAGDEYDNELGNIAGSAYVFDASSNPGGPLGAPCISDLGCTSGFCADGVCCDTACGQSNGADCQACSMAAGAATDGTCATFAAGVVCRDAMGDCDTAETCDGSSTVCPSDTILAAGTMCRPATDACDADEVCDGASPWCPLDDYLPPNTPCRPSAGACDSEEVCDGWFAACPSDDFLPANTVCRPSAGSCDVEEVCNGSSGVCPADTYQQAGVICRAAAGACDSAEVCDGQSLNCPVDGVVAAGTLCRPIAGPCDQPESCDGQAAACPADAYAAAGSICRTATDVCDLEEVCLGNDVQCPVDSKRPATDICRPTNGECDAVEFCTGSTNACPQDTAQPDGTACMNGVCQSGTCQTGGSSSSSSSSSSTGSSSSGSSSSSSSSSSTGSSSSGSSSSSSSSSTGSSSSGSSSSSSSSSSTGSSSSGSSSSSGNGGAGGAGGEAGKGGAGGAGGSGGAGAEGGVGGEGGGDPLTNNDTIKIDRGFCSYSPVPTSSNAPWVFVGLSILAARRRNREYGAQRPRQSRH